MSSEKDDHQPYFPFNANHAIDRYPNPATGSDGTQAISGAA